MQRVTICDRGQWCEGLVGKKQIEILKNIRQQIQEVTMTPRAEIDLKGKLPLQTAPVARG